MNAEWDRRWNTVCLGIITIATATVAAAFFAADVANSDFSSQEFAVRILQLAKISTIFIVLLVHLRLVIAASKSIFTSSADLERAGTSKRAQTAYVFEGFIIILMLLVILLVVNLLTDLAVTLD